MSDNIIPKGLRINANAIAPEENRGHDTRFTEQDDPQYTVTLERINDTIMNYLENVIKPTITDGEVSVAVPIMYATPERWATIRKDGAMRDSANDKFLTPLIVLGRTQESRNSTTNPANKYVHTTIDGGWNPRNAYDRFAVQNNIRPSRQVRHVVVPDYVDLTYDVVLWTEYQQQMDQLIEQINVEIDEYWGEENEFKFLVKVTEYQNKSELPPVGDRVVRRMFSMKIHAYLVSERMVKNFKLASTNSKVYTAKKIVAFLEVVSKMPTIPRKRRTE